MQFHLQSPIPDLSNTYQFNFQAFACIRKRNYNNKNRNKNNKNKNNGRKTTETTRTRAT